ncbi:MAG: homocysteine S-methyltransferase family protein, partial [Microthrixaceae bacterium]
MAASPFLDAVRSRVVIYDGAAGTWLQEQDLQMEDYGTPELEGCPEILNETRPELIKRMHSEYFEAGADIVETNSFGGMRATLGEYGLGDRTEELNEMAARIAREAADEHSTPERPRMVAGSIGPGTRFASLGHVSYEELRDQVAEQARGLLRGGVDVLLIETQFDMLGIKASMNGCRDAMAQVGIEVPLQVQVTIELTGRMLPGTEIGAAL